MAVQPQVPLFFPCADARTDVSNNSITIVDPIRTLYLPKGTHFPHGSGVIFFYAALAEGVGTFHCRIEVRSDDGVLVRKSKPVSLTFTPDNRLDGVEFVLQFPEFELPRGGVYEFGLFANYSAEPLARTCIRFLEGS